MDTPTIKQTLKSKTIKFNLAMIPIITYLISVPELWTGYFGAGANIALLLGNVLLRTMTSEPLSNK